MREQSLGLLLVVFLALSPGAMAQDEIQQDSPPTPIAQATPSSPAPPVSQEAEQKAPENPPEPESHGTRLRWQDIPKNVLHDQIAIFTSPFHIHRDNAKLWIGFGGATAALIALDQKVSNNMAQQNKLTTPSRWASRLGSDYFLMPAWASFYVVGKIGDNPRARDTAQLGIEALIDADITAGILKVATQRPRPEVRGQSVAFFRGGDAFPSGHSIKAWALARVVSREFSENRIVPIVAYSLATTVAVARVGGRRHSPSDALAGSAMGFFIGDLVYRHHHAPSEKAKPVVWIADHVTFTIGP
jgi:membrane-associated phospholipid phosphatase